MAGNGRRARSYKIDTKLCRMKMDAVLTPWPNPFVLSRKKGLLFQPLGSIVSVSAGPARDSPTMPQTSACTPAAKRVFDFESATGR
ncbi:hypothetical protein ABIF63_007652 [Bradyrhizobium japonicum]|uniref:Uncharacterized protein n=1 Tax=Bradyrhizobium japonicum TaxID=375 RepID=A0ABV2S2Y3_BRAJP